MTANSAPSQVFVTNGNVSVRNKPVNLAIQDTTIFEHEFLKSIAPGHVLIARNAVVVYDGIFDPHTRKFFTAYTHPKPEARGYRSLLPSLIRRLLLLKLLTKLDVIDKAVWITDNWSSAYFHWFTESMPRLLASRCLLSGHVVILPARLNKYPFISQSLKQLKVPFRFLKPHSPVRIVELVLPSHMAEPGNYHPVLMNETRDAFAINDAMPHRRVFISRRKCKNRTIANEPDVEDALYEYGFETHCFEDYSVERQIEIMSQTSTLAGLHGAGLTNMMFMKKGSQVLELRDEIDSHNNCYFSLASDLGIDYYYLLNRAERNESGGVKIRVDIGRLKNVLSLIFSSQS